MKARRCPKGCVDWHEKLLQVARSRRATSQLENRRDQNQWDDAVKLLEKSQKSIHIQKTGHLKGSVVGIPEKVASVIQQVFIKIVEGVETVNPQDIDNQSHVKLEDDKLLRNLAYRASNYALLAALYENFRGPCEQVKHNSKFFLFSQNKNQNIIIISNNSYSCGLQGMDIQAFETSATKHTHHAMAAFNYKTGAR